MQRKCFCPSVLLSLTTYQWLKGIVEWFLSIRNVWLSLKVDVSRQHKVHFTYRRHKRINGIKLRLRNRNIRYCSLYIRHYEIQSLQSFFTLKQGTATWDNFVDIKIKKIPISLLNPSVLFIDVVHRYDYASSMVDEWNKIYTVHWWNNKATVPVLNYDKTFARVQVYLSPWIPTSNANIIWRSVVSSPPMPLCSGNQSPLYPLNESEWAQESVWSLWKEKSLPLTGQQRKVISEQAWTGAQGSRRLRLPDFKTLATWRWIVCKR